MDYKRFLLVAITTLITTSLQSAVILPGILPAQQVLAQTREAQKAEADRLLNQGFQQYQRSQIKAALQSWEQALQIYRQISDRDGEGRALGNLGVAYYSLGDYNKAIEYNEQYLAIAKQIGDKAGLGAALRNLGNVYYSLGDYKKAIELFQQGLAIAKQIGDKAGEGKALNNLGVAYRSLGDYQKAIELFQQGLAIAKQIGDKAGEGTALGNLGNVYYSLGDYKKAIELFQQGLAIAKQIGNKAGEGAALNNLGVAYRYLGDYQKAIEYHQQHLAIAKQIGDKAGEGTALGNLGNVYDSLGDYQKAIEYHQQHLVIAKQIGNKAGEGAALNNLGIAYYSLGDYNKAIEYNEQYLAIAKQIGNKAGEGTTLNNLGIAYRSLGDYNKAIKYHKQYLAIAKQIGDKAGEGTALGNLGVAYHSLGDYKKAIEFYQQHLAIAKQIGDRAGEGTALGNLGVAYRSLGDYNKAIDFYQQSLAIAKQIGDRAGEGISLNNLGFALFKSRNLASAQKVLKQGIEVWKSQHNKQEKDEFKISIFEEQARTYRTLQQVYIAQNKPNAALEVAESGRARALVDLLASRLDIPPIEPTIDQIKQIAKAQNATLVQYSRITDKFKIAGKQQTKESELYIWVIKPTGEITFRKTDLKPLWQKNNTTLASLVINSRAQIGVRAGGITSDFDPNTSKTKNRFKQLHELLIKPIADLLPKNPDDRVIFVPQSSLFLVPFPALQDEQGKYLIDKHTILTAPAIQVLDLTRKKRQQVNGNQMLIVGNPTMPKIGEPPQQLDNLPGAENEAKAIAQLFNTKAITGKDATKAAIIQRLPQARIIHLATHGLLDDFKGLGVPGAIALAPNGKDNGLLTANEILDLKINAELVVLSACDTGQGKLTGDGVVGLSRALISAGAPSIIVTLWKIPDQSTVTLMTEFYQQLSKSKDKAKALRQAMLSTKEKHPHPSHWAAFTLIGEAK